MVPSRGMADDEPIPLNCPHRPRRTRYLQRDRRTLAVVRLSGARLVCDWRGWCLQRIPEQPIYQRLRMSRFYRGLCLFGRSCVPSKTLKSEGWSHDDVTAKNKYLRLWCGEGREAQAGQHHDGTEHVSEATDSAGVDL